MAQEIDYHFVGTYTRYSSWTARVEAVLEYFQIPHTAQIIKLSDVKTVSPSGLVPYLQCRSMGSTTISDSLAICEFLAESNPELSLWPRDRQLRALARSAAAQMHSGFSTLRTLYGTNFVGRYTGNVPIPEEAVKDVRRMLALWDEARKATKERLAILGAADEGFLFGGFSIADAFFWPVLWRFRTYGLPLTSASEDALAWMGTMWNDPAFQSLSTKYYVQLKDPETRIEQYDDVYQGQADIQYGHFPEDWKFSTSQ
ncbi:glutathione S transferase [Penicillium verhagenii]|uniref:glutathione S transferase n=1 Tax=Penicillium verhagenii TaxID=1562060 RepID=UPI0025453FA4|nr:glutathione S transferase [Penicillium verhagenii]KAJ5921432.1 glutathione S transferase [Penicillium verhagenii]